VDLRYWDSNCFLGWLLEEADKADECRAVLEEAKAGRIVLVTSALTLAEVVKLGKGKDPIPAGDATKIRDFFKQEYVEVRNLDRFVAEDARNLVWDKAGLHPKDTVHLATALRLRLRLFNTFDDDLLKLSGTLGVPPMVIRRPSLPQEKLPLEDASGTP